MSTARAVGQLSLALFPIVPTRGPHRSSDVTAEFLTEHLGATAPGAVALDAELLGGTTGTTDRRHLRVEWNAAGTEAGLPTSLFVKSTPLSAKNRTMVAALDMAVNEAKFYKQAADAVGDRAPQAYFAFAGVGARHLILLEDLTAAGCRPFALTDDCPIEHARSLVDVFAGLHAAFWESPRLSRDLSWVRRWSNRPGYAVLKRFYRRGRRDALRLDLPEITPAVRRLRGALDTRTEEFYRQFEAGPLTFLHGDSHLGNTYSLPDGHAGLLDWQVVWQGPGLRELSYFITTGLDPDVRRVHDRELVERYVEELRSRGVADAPTTEKAFYYYRLFAAEAWDATAMTVAWPGLQAAENAHAGWRRACVAIEDNDTAALIEEL